MWKKGCMMKTFDIEFSQNFDFPLLITKHRVSKGERAMSPIKPPVTFEFKLGNQRDFLIFHQCFEFKMIIKWLSG